jgi:hypothetical protein
MTNFVYPSLSFSQEELVLLLKLFDATTIPGTGKDPLAGLNEEQQRLLLSSAERNLKARGVLAAPNHEQIRVDQFTVALIGPCVFPEHSILLSQIFIGKEPRNHYFHHGQRVITEHFLSDLALHTFVSLPGKVALQQQLMILIEFPSAKDQNITKKFQVSMNVFQDGLTLLFETEKERIIKYGDEKVQAMAEIFLGSMLGFKGLSSMIFIDHQDLEGSISIDLLHTECAVWQVQRTENVAEISKLATQDFIGMISELLETFPQDPPLATVGM